MDSSSRNSCLDIIFNSQRPTQSDQQHAFLAGKHIAEKLELNYVFFCEFEEIHSPLRSPELQVLVQCQADAANACYMACLHSHVCIGRQSRSPETVSNVGRRSAWKCTAQQI